MRNSTFDLTTIILFHDDLQLLEKAIQSVLWSEEIMVIEDNDHSSINPVEKNLLIEKYNLHWISSPLENNFSRQRNKALEKAKHEWVFFLDSDEVISKLLAQEIQNVLIKTTYNGFSIKRTDIFMNKVLYYGETGSISFVRLAKKKAGKWHSSIHETWEIESPVQSLLNPILHFPHENISSFFAKLNTYTTILAHEKGGESFTKIIFQFFIYPLAKFFQNYVLKLGFLDGIPGLFMAYMMSLHSLILRVKMYEQRS